MGYKTIFKRYELKFILTLDQKAKILAAMEPYMELDQYGRSTIRNLYYDTDSFRLIRHSIEKPKYKEKLRVRSYERSDADSTVFVELKKKYDGIVYKRRVSLPEHCATEWLCDGAPCPKSSQITREIDYFMQFYGRPHPVVFLSYEREAYFTKSPSDFRVTFDENILCRSTDLSLKADVYGDSILESGMVLMEIKCSGGLPLWMVQILSAEKIYKTSFSKYGTAYQKLIFPRLMQKRSADISSALVNT